MCSVGHTPVLSSCTMCVGTPVLAAPAATCTTRRRRLSLKGDSTTCCCGGMWSSCRMLARVRGAAVADRASTARGCRMLVIKWPSLQARTHNTSTVTSQTCASTQRQLVVQ